MAPAAPFSFTAAWDQLQLMMALIVFWGRLESTTTTVVDPR